MTITQSGNKLWINDKEIEQPKSLFFNNCLRLVDNKVYINGKEFKNGKWKYTIRSIINTLF